uniref:Uncharacterized protein n=1 Tax=Leersia perrieri TaxID=77586 RepID=A0A0D9Y0K6_9ORYZ
MIFLPYAAPPPINAAAIFMAVLAVPPPPPTLQIWPGGMDLRWGQIHGTAEPPSRTAGDDADSSSSLSNLTSLLAASSHVSGSSPKACACLGHPAATDCNLGDGI